MRGKAQWKCVGNRRKDNRWIGKMDQETLFIYLFICLFVYLLIYLFIHSIFIYFWERDRVWAGEEQREKERQNPKQAPGSELSAQSLMRGSNSHCEIMTWDEAGCLTDWATQVPLGDFNQNMMWGKDKNMKNVEGLEG